MNKLLILIYIFALTACVETKEGEIKPNLISNFVSITDNEDKGVKEVLEYYGRYHESLNNLTPADVYYGREKSILEQRKLTKIKTMKRRRKDYLLQSLNL